MIKTLNDFEIEELEIKLHKAKLRKVFLITEMDKLETRLENISNKLDTQMQEISDQESYVRSLASKLSYKKRKK